MNSPSDSAIAASSASAALVWKQKLRNATAVQKAHKNELVQAVVDLGLDCTKTNKYEYVASICKALGYPVPKNSLDQLASNSLKRSCKHPVTTEPREPIDQGGITSSWYKRKKSPTELLKQRFAETFEQKNLTAVIQRLEWFSEPEQIALFQQSPSDRQHVVSSDTSEQLETVKNLLFGIVEKLGKTPEATLAIAHEERMRSKDPNTQSGSGSPTSSSLELSSNDSFARKQKLLKSLSSHTAQRLAERKFGEIKGSQIVYIVNADRIRAKKNSGIPTMSLSFIDQQMNRGSAELMTDSATQEQYSLCEVGNVVRFDNYLTSAQSVGDDMSRGVFIVKTLKLVYSSPIRFASSEINNLPARPGTELEMVRKPFTILESQLPEQYEPVPLPDGESFPFTCDGTRCSQEMEQLGSCLVKHYPVALMDLLAVGQRKFGEKYTLPNERGFLRKLAYIGYSNLYNCGPDNSNKHWDLPSCVQVAIRSTYPNEAGRLYSGLKSVWTLGELMRSSFRKGDDDSSSECFNNYHNVECGSDTENHDNNCDCSYAKSDSDNEYWY